MRPERGCAVAPFASCLLGRRWREYHGGWLRSRRVTGIVRCRHRRGLGLRSQDQARFQNGEREGPVRLTGAGRWAGGKAAGSGVTALVPAAAVEQARGSRPGPAHGGVADRLGGWPEGAISAATAAALAWPLATAAPARRRPLRSRLTCLRPAARRTAAMRPAARPPAQPRHPAD